MVSFQCITNIKVISEFLHYFIKISESDVSYLHHTSNSDYSYFKCSTAICG